MTLQDTMLTPTSDTVLMMGGSDEHGPAPLGMTLSEFMSLTFPSVLSPLGAAPHENEDFAMLFVLDHKLHTQARHALKLVEGLDT